MLMNQTTLYPANMAEDSLESLFAAHGPQRLVIYWLLLLGVIGALVALPLIKVDVAVRASGWVRPSTERAELRPAVSGHIAQVLARDNDRVSVGQALLTLNTHDIEERLARNRALQHEKADVIADLGALTLERITGSAGFAGSSLVELRTAVFRQDREQFHTQVESYRLAESKARNELARYTTLAAKGIATTQELDNARYEADRLRTESKLLVEQTLSRWQTRLRDEQTALADLASEEQRLKEEQAHYTVRAPAEGELVGFSGLSAGGFVAAGQTLGAVSPGDALLVETFVSPRDIGLVRVGQSARLQIDAYSYTQWGALDATVESISGDMMSAGAVAPGAAAGGVFFKVVVRPHGTTLQLSNGVRGELRKGMTLSARFIVARRSLLQILYENVSSWLDPKAQAT